MATTNNDDSVVELDTSLDCVIEEAHISTIEILDSSLDISKCPEHDPRHIDIDDDVVMDSQVDSAIGTQSQTSAGHNHSQGPLSPNGPVLRVAFKDADTFNELHSVVSACIRDTLFARKKAIEVSVIHSEYTVYFNELDGGDGFNDSIFMIDTLPTEDENAREVPDYEASFHTVLANGDQSPENEEERLDKPKNCCWNCGGDHMLRDCTAPRDSRQIGRSKAAFSRGKNERYHVDADQKFGRFMPGIISEDLRNALGLRPRELPIHVYQMRLFGYPPGWLDDAKVAPSGMSLFVSEVSS